MRSRAGAGAAGFTLLELLVALTVLGFILVGLAQGIHFGLLVWGMETRLASGNDDLTTFDATLRNVIEGADPGDDLDPAPFIGTRDRMACTTALPNVSATAPHRRIEAVLMVDAQHRLMLHWQPYLHAMRLKPAPAPNDTELLHDVSQIELSYWQPATGWVTAWRASDLPTLVRIRVVFTPGDPRHWPDVVAATRLNRP